MDARRQSLLFALAGGAAVGAIALCVRWAPGRPRRGETPATASASAAHAPAAETTLAPPAPDVGALAARTPSRSRSERFAAEPSVRAACPLDMNLVEGEFCPSLPYACLRRSEDAGHRCAEYARANRCLAEPDHRRYCVDRHEWPNVPGENPRVFVDWHEAKQLCSQANKRLCRRSEWILACEGPKRLPYPWGFVRQPSPCNIDRASIPFDVPAMMKDETRESELTRLWQADRIGSHPDCVSAFGAYDMSGNVDEWTDDQADDPGSQNPSTLNGGYWGPVRDTCRLTTKSHGPTFRFYQVGFRCCADTIDGVVVPPPRPFVERDDRKREPDSAGEGTKD